VFITALVSEPVYITNPTAVPAARTVLDHSTFSAVSGSTLGTGTKGTSSGVVGREERSTGGGGVLMVNVPMKEWMSFMGVSAAKRIRYHHVNQ
jgi:hypothetical protein